MRRLLGVFILALTAFSLTAASVMAYEFPSTNDENRSAQLPHVNVVETGVGYVTLEFVNTTNSQAFFEYRIDGVQQGTTAHPIVGGDVIHPGVCVDNRVPEKAECGGPTTHVTKTFTANATVEVRLALGGERQWDFDWVSFDVLPDVQTKDECLDGGYEAFGFSNQGQCVRFIESGKDSR